MENKLKKTKPIKSIRHIPDDPRRLWVYYTYQYYYPSSKKADSLGYVHSWLGYHFKFLRKWI